MSTYGYIRVSSKEQNEGRQLIAMRELEIPDSNIYIGKQSGKDFNRPAYKQMLRDWRDKKITLQQAAAACKMPKDTFYYRAVQLEQINTE